MAHKYPRIFKTKDPGMSANSKLGSRHLMILEPNGFAVWCHDDGSMRESRYYREELFNNSDMFTANGYLWIEVFRADNFISVLKSWIYDIPA